MKRIAPLCLFLLLEILAGAQTWSVLLDSQDVYRRTIAITTDSFILVSGYDLHEDLGFTSKLDRYGQLQWQIAKGGHKVEATADSGCILISSINNYPRLIKVDKMGNVAWDRYYPFPGFAYFLDIIELEDGSFIATGSLDSVLTAKFNSSGKYLWDVKYGFGHGGRGNNIVKDGGSLKVFVEFADTANFSNLGLLEIDSAGQLVQKEIITAKEAYSHDFYYDEESNQYLIYGYDLVTRLNSDFQLIDTFNLTRNMNVWGFGKYNGQYVITGYRNSSVQGTTETQSFIFTCYPDLRRKRPFYIDQSIAETMNIFYGLQYGNNLITTGTFRTDTGTGYAVINFINFYSMVSYTWSVAEVNGFENSLYPNPNNGTFTLKSAAGHYSYQITDIKGFEVSSGEFMSNGVHRFNIEASKGLFFIRLVNEDGEMVVRKILIQ
ncbi:T9SS type A sorting domain-containing protein [bacterium]|nr:T9SS type A sorting domain-containing protein [bacterium]